MRAHAWLPGNATIRYVASLGPARFNKLQFKLRAPADPPPVAVAPSMVLSTDSVVMALTAGADSVAQVIDVSPGTTAALTGLAVADPAVGAGEPTTWVTATISAQTAPAKLTIVLRPGTL